MLKVFEASLLRKGIVSGFPRRLKHDFVAPTWDLNERKPRLTPEKWDYYDQVVWPPHYQQQGKAKPAEVFHYRENIKYSPLKMWYICHFVGGRSIEDALTQLDYIYKKGAVIMKEVLLEAQRKAVEEHFVEFKSNLWIAEAMSKRGLVIKGLRRHRGERWGTVYYCYTNLYVRLQEGKPPVNFSRYGSYDGWKKLEECIDNFRNRRIRDIH